MTGSSARLLRKAMILSVITIIYNLIEGGISTFFGIQDDTLALFGFGVDSFVEVISAIGISHMIWRMRRTKVEQKDQFEITALRITGTAFYLLMFGLIAGALFSIFYEMEPQTTKVGIIIALISLITMYILYIAKLRVGKKLDNQAIISDAKCTKSCFYLSIILLSSSLIYELWGIPYIDALGSIGIAFYAWKEGKEAFASAKSKSLSCASECC